jgi:hypothetical protein
VSQFLPILLVVLPFAGWGLVAGLAWVWLRHTITPGWVRQLFESEGEASVRLVLAPIIIIYTLLMQAAGRISDHSVEANYFLAATLLGLGTAKLVGKAFATRPPAPATEVKTETAQVDAAGDININGARPQL